MPFCSAGTTTSLMVQAPVASVSHEPPVSVPSKYSSTDSVGAKFDSVALKVEPCGPESVLSTTEGVATTVKSAFACNVLDWPVAVSVPLPIVASTGTSTLVEQSPVASVSHEAP